MRRLHTAALGTVSFLALFGVGAGFGELVGGESNDKPSGRERKPGLTATDRETQAPLPGRDGLAIAGGGNSLRIGQSRLVAGRTRPFRFAIVGKKGKVLRRFDSLDGARMHLIVVPHDLGAIQHIVPVQDSDGRWFGPVRAPEPGAYRVYADFARDRLRQTLGIELSAPGNSDRPTAPKPSTNAQAGPFAVALAPGALLAGRAENLTFTVTREDQSTVSLAPVAGGAHGYLVAVRYGDYALVHAAPSTVSDSKRRLGFRALFTEPGRYRLFLQFRSTGALYTAGMTVDVTR